MKVAVDVKKVIQEIDLDTGETSNYLIFRLGDVEHKVSATEDQLQRAIIEARLQETQSNGHGFHPSGTEISDISDTDPGGVFSDVEEPIQAPPIGAVGQIPDVGASSEFVESMLEEPIDDQEVAQAITGAAPAGLSAFADVNVPVTEDEMAEYVSEGAPVHPLKVNVVSDGDPGGATFEEIMDRPAVANPNAPLSAQQQRRVNIDERHQAGKPQGQQAVIKALREKAKKVPPRRLPPHQVDEMGNPIVQKIARTAPRRPVDPSQPTVRHAPVPPGLAGLDDDGFEQG